MSIISDNKNQTKPRVVVFECDNCSSKFERGSKTKPKLDYRLLERDKHYCSTRCAYDDREIKTMKQLLCDNCGKQFSKLECKIKNTNFCSRKCHGNYKSKTMSGHVPRYMVMTNENKRKISIATKKRFSDPKNHPFYGKHHSEETKKKISDNRPDQSGKNNPMYGKNHSAESKEKMSKAHTELILNGRQTYGNGHATGHYLSSKTCKEYFYRSSWELACMKWLDKNPCLKTYDYESVKIQYVDEDKNRFYKRYYVPDFLLTFEDGHQELWEIKPKQFVNNKRTVAKTEAAEQYCYKHNISKFRILTKDDLLLEGIL